MDPKKFVILVPLLFIPPGQQLGLLHVLLLAKPRPVPQPAELVTDPKEFMSPVHMPPEKEDVT